MPQRGTAALAASSVRRVIWGFVGVVIFPSLRCPLQPAVRVVDQLDWAAGPKGPDQLALVIGAAALSGDGKERPGGRPHTRTEGRKAAHRAVLGRLRPMKGRPPSWSLPQCDSHCLIWRDMAFVEMP